jgi:hypothetical protein
LTARYGPALTRGWVSHGGGFTGAGAATPTTPTGVSSASELDGAALADDDDRVMDDERLPSRDPVAEDDLLADQNRLIRGHARRPLHQRLPRLGIDALAILADVDPVAIALGTTLVGPAARVEIGR